MNNKIILYGKPIALKRPRFSRTGLVYNAQKREMLELSFLVKEQWDSPKITSAVRVDMSFFMPIPKSLSKRKRLKLLDTYNYSHIDIDNIYKFYADVITMSGVWEDDCLMSEIFAFKKYSDNPRVEIEITIL